MKNDLIAAMHGLRPSGPLDDVQDPPNELLHVICDGLQAVAVIQYIGHRQIDPTQLADIAGKLDGRE